MRAGGSKCFRLRAEIDGNEVRVSPVLDLFTKDVVLFSNRFVFGTPQDAVRMRVLGGNVTIEVSVVAIESIHARSTNEPAWKRRLPLMNLEKRFGNSS